MIKRNDVFTRLSSNYLFPQIQACKDEFLKSNPGVKLINLGIGDTTVPLSNELTDKIKEYVEGLNQKKIYSGYGPEQGIVALREKIANTFYNDLINPEEIFISDGAKCDIGRLQILLGPYCVIGVQDPTYPVYVDGSILQGVREIKYIPCIPENNFFPPIKDLPNVDVLYLCSPNNPTGTALTRQQLQDIVNWAIQTKTLLVYDAAYASFIQDPQTPKSIYEIDGSKLVAIEINSFSKMAGFTGIRLGWSVVPKHLVYDNGLCLWQDWKRTVCTIFNGASNIAQAAGLALLEENIFQCMNKTISYYLENTNILKSAILNTEIEVYGGRDAPYLWIRNKRISSWNYFHYFLNEYHLITTPGIGFGSSGENFLRLSAFGKREDVIEAAKKLSFQAQLA